MDGKPSGVRKVMSTPSLRAFAASDVKVRTTPLTWGCHASVAMRTRIRGWAGCRSVERIELCKHHHLMSQPCDDGIGSPGDACPLRRKGRGLTVFWAGWSQAAVTRL